MTVRQHSFYLEDEDWTALRHYCLDHGLSVSSFIAQAARDAVDDIRKADRSAKTANALALNGETIKDVRIMEVSLVKDPPHPSMTVTTATGAPAVIPTNPVRAVPKPTPKKKAVRS